MFLLCRNIYVSVTIVVLAGGLAFVNIWSPNDAVPAVGAKAELWQAFGFDRNKALSMRQIIFAGETLPSQVTTTFTTLYFL